MVISLFVLKDCDTLIPHGGNLAVENRTQDRIYLILSFKLYILNSDHKTLLPRNVLCT